MQAAPGPPSGRGCGAGRKNPRAVPPPTEHGGEATGGDDQAGQEEAGAEGPTDAEDGARFFSRSGLLARDLAGAVTRSVTCGFGYPDQRFYTYDGGVWLPDDGRIEGGDHPTARQSVPQRAHPQRARPDPALAEHHAHHRQPAGRMGQRAQRHGRVEDRRPAATLARLPLDRAASRRVRRGRQVPAVREVRRRGAAAGPVRADRRRTGFHLGTHRLHPLLGQPAARRRPAARLGAATARAR